MAILRKVDWTMDNNIRHIQVQDNVSSEVRETLSHMKLHTIYRYVRCEPHFVMVETFVYMFYTPMYLNHTEYNEQVTEYYMYIDKMSFK